MVYGFWFLVSGLFTNLSVDLSTDLSAVTLAEAEALEKVGFWFLVGRVM